MIVCSCTARTTEDFDALYDKYASKNLKDEILARYIWKDFGKASKKDKDRCGVCIMQVVRLIKERRGKIPPEAN
jgi:hypothetical protein